MIWLNMKKKLQWQLTIYIRTKNKILLKVKNETKKKGQKITKYQEKVSWPFLQIQYTQKVGAGHHNTDCWGF